MRSKYLAFAMFAAMATVPVAACSHSYTEAGDIAPASGLGVHVTNDNFLDMDVFAVSEGVATRLGTVTGNSSRDFNVGGRYANRDLSIVATPIGGAGRASTGSLNVSGGQTIDFQIGSVLANSSVMIR
ncbi:MAG TPA: hypothetical protein VHV78_16525 [Gemmatimonadaceae bacterium]|jgi:hypothetical protein|nr:hypothetical protein [Gemmatimonadaceae bacterium]